MGSQNYTSITHLVKKAQKKKVEGLIQTSLKWMSLLTIFITFLFLINFYLDLEKNRNSISQSQVMGVEAPVLPVRLTIPAINVDTTMQVLGVTQEGEMEVPTNATDVGWFKLGPRPGEKGSSVIAGHFDNENGGAGVFANLYKLKKGDKLFVKDNKGKVITFIVRESRTYDPGYTDDVFNFSDGSHLNLITCDGVWDGINKSYSKRLVVFADIMY